MRKRRINVFVTALVALVTVASLSHFVGFRHHRHHHGFHGDRHAACAASDSDKKSDSSTAHSNENTFNENK